MWLDKRDARRWMKRELTTTPEDFLDCGTVRCTALGEAYLFAIEWPHEDVPEEVWDAAFEASEWWGRAE